MHLRNVQLMVYTRLRGAVRFVGSVGVSRSSTQSLPSDVVGRPPSVIGVRPLPSSGAGLSHAFGDAHGRVAVGSVGSRVQDPRPDGNTSVMRQTPSRAVRLRNRGRLARKVGVLRGVPAKSHGRRRSVTKPYPCTRALPNAGGGVDVDVGTGDLPGVDPFNGAFDAELYAELGRNLLGDAEAAAVPAPEQRDAVLQQSRLKRRRGSVVSSEGKVGFVQGPAAQAAAHEVDAEEQLPEFTADGQMSAMGFDADAPPALTGWSGAAGVGLLDLEFVFSGQKPRAFDNMLTDCGGAGSCWINAVLQALFAPPVIQRCLADVCRRLPASIGRSLHREAVMRRRKNFASLQQYTVDGSRRRLEDIAARSSPTCLEQTFLAATFRSAFFEPFTQPLCPYLVTDHFYAGWQEDAGELLARHFLNSECAPVVAEAVRGELSEVLKCTGCGHRSQCGREPFHELQLPILSEDAVDVKFLSVGQALSQYMRGDLVSRAECCLGCGASNGQYEKLPEFVAFPQVLVLVLKRWRVTADGHGGHCQLCVPHGVRADRHLQVAGQGYDLKSSIIHLGSSPDRGHYIAVARHPTSGGDWWLYDDGTRRLASPEEILGEGKYRSISDMKTYVLFYQKVGL